MARAIQKFIANDGTEFATEAEANGHDAALAGAASIDAYIASTGLKKAQATFVRGHVAAYLKHRAGAALEAFSKVEPASTEA